MEARRQTSGQKRLCPNQQVSGAVGDFIEGGPTKRRQKGAIIQKCNQGCRFGSVEEMKLPSAVLKVESIAASIPPDVPPAAENIRE
jgi:hypothetical protein